MRRICEREAHYVVDKFAAAHGWAREAKADRRAITGDRPE
jgi:hypothetical protein